MNAHNGRIPRDWWLAEWERSAILDFHDRHPLEGYRRLTFMMLDDDVVATSPASVYRVLKRAGRLDRKWQKASKKGTGFVQPLRAHDHWHVDVSYLNLGVYNGGTFTPFSGPPNGIVNSAILYGINDHGAVVGQFHDVNESGTRGFLGVVPEPGSLVLCTLGSLTLLAFFDRKRTRTDNSAALETRRGNRH